jgi:mutual gliding-motility protein MglA
MPYIGFHNREVSFKIVYYGPGMSGKTTNLIHIHKSLRPDRKGEMVMLDTEEERTLFFDFFPLELGEVEGFSVRFNMYTVPGQSYYEASRKLVLDSADGVVFVADSQTSRLQENLDAYAQLLEQLA